MPTRSPHLTPARWSARLDRAVTEAEGDAVLAAMARAEPTEGSTAGVPFFIVSGTKP